MNSWNRFIDRKNYWKQPIENYRKGETYNMEILLSIEFLVLKLLQIF